MGASSEGFVLLLLRVDIQPLLGFALSVICPKYQSGRESWGLGVYEEKWLVSDSGRHEMELEFGTWDLEICFDVTSPCSLIYLVFWVGPSGVGVLVDGVKLY